MSVTIRNYIRALIAAAALLASSVGFAAITRSSSPYAGLGSTASGARTLTNVTIPAGYDVAVIHFGYWYAGVIPNISAVTLDGQTATQVDTADTSNGQNLSDLWIVTGFASGASKTVAWTNSTTMTIGVTVEIEFLSGVDTATFPTSSIRTNGNNQNDTSASVALSVMTAGDFILSAYAGDDTTSPTFGSGQTQGANQAAGSLESGFSYESAAGASDTQVVNGDFVGLVSVALIPSSGGGGGSAPSTNIILQLSN